MKISHTNYIVQNPGIFVMFFARMIQVYKKIEKWATWFFLVETLLKFMPNPGKILSSAEKALYVFH